MSTLRPRKKGLPYIVGALLCAVIAVSCLSGYLGACSGLVEGDTGGAGEPLALAFAAIFGGAALVVFKSRPRR